jgi:hypothetical protein
MVWPALCLPHARSVSGVLGFCVALDKCLKLQCSVAHDMTEFVLWQHAVGWSSRGLACLMPDRSDPGVPGSLVFFKSRVSA